MSFKDWWKKIAETKVPEDVFLEGEYHIQKHSKSITHTRLNYHFEGLRQSYEKDIKKLKRYLLIANRERKTPPREVFQAQLVKVLQAHEVVAHSHILGVNKSGLGEVALKNLNSEISKLFALAYLNLDSSDEAIEAVYEEFKSAYPFEGVSEEKE